MNSFVRYLKIELLLEWRHRSRLIHALLFGTLLAVLCGLAYDRHLESSPATFAGTLWIVILFASTTLIGESAHFSGCLNFKRQLVLSGLRPETLFMTRILFTTFSVIVVGMSCIGLFKLLVPRAPTLDGFGVVLPIVALGVSTLGSLISAMVHSAQLNKLVLPLLLYPLLMPLIVPAITLTAEGGNGLHIIVGFTMVYAGLTYWLSPLIFEE